MKIKFANNDNNNYIVALFINIGDNELDNFI